MPIYEYVCNQCGKMIDVLQKLNDPAPNKCEGCGTEAPLTKVLSRSSFVLKGGGWYSDLYGSSKKDAKDAKKGESTASTATSTPPASSGASTSTSTSSSTSTPTAPSTSTPSSSSGGDKK